MTLMSRRHCNEERYVRVGYSRDNLVFSIQAALTGHTGFVVSWLNDSGSWDQWYCTYTWTCKTKICFQWVWFNVCRSWALYGLSSLAMERESQAASYSPELCSDIKAMSHACSSGSHRSWLWAKGTEQSCWKQSLDELWDNNLPGMALLLVQPGHSTALGRALTQQAFGCGAAALPTVTKTTDLRWQTHSLFPSVQGGVNCSAQPVSPWQQVGKWKQWELCMSLQVH